MAVPGQNLISQTKFSEHGHQPGFYKAIVLDALSVASALLFGYLYFWYLARGISPWYVLGALFLFSSLSVLQAFLQSGTGRRALILLAEAVGLLVFFSTYDDFRILGVAFSIVFVFLYWGYLSARGYLKNSIEVPFFGTARAVLGKLTTAALLAMILVYAPQVGTRGAPVPRESFKTFFDWSSGFLNNFFPGVPFNDSFQTFSQEIAKMELANNPTFQAMTQRAQNAAITQATAQIANTVKQTTGVAPAAGDQVSDVVYNYIVATLAGWQARFQGEFIIGWTIVLFLILRTAGTVFIWIAEIVALIFYEILLSAGFMRVVEVPQTKEVVEY